MVNSLKNFVNIVLNKLKLDTWKENVGDALFISAS